MNELTKLLIEAAFQIAYGVAIHFSVDGVVKLLKYLGGKLQKLQAPRTTSGGFLKNYQKENLVRKLND